MTQMRQTAYKVRIGDILRGEYYKNLGEWDPNYVLINNKKVSRVNLIATVVDKSLDENSGTVEVDDGSGSIRLRFWGEDIKILDKIIIGDLILIIGKVKKYNEEIYLTPEIARKLSDISWAKLRKIELEKEYGKLTVKKEAIIEKKDILEKGSESIRQKLLSLINKVEEANFEEVISESGLSEAEAKKIINDLLKEGEIYQSRPGFLKAI